jgi:hypothetical protein
MSVVSGHVCGMTAGPREPLSATTTEMKKSTSLLDSIRGQGKSDVEMIPRVLCCCTEARVAPEATGRLATLAENF